MTSIPSCVVGHCFGPRLTAGACIVWPWSISLEKFRDIFVGGRTGKTRFSSFISSFEKKEEEERSFIKQNG
jgi:hypothetical protein